MWLPYNANIGNKIPQLISYVRFPGKISTKTFPAKPYQPFFDRKTTFPATNFTAKHRFTWLPGREADPNRSLLMRFAWLFRSDFSVNIRTSHLLLIIRGHGTWRPILISDVVFIPVFVAFRGCCRKHFRPPCLFILFIRKYLRKNAGIVSRRFINGGKSRDAWLYRLYKRSFDGQSAKTNFDVCITLAVLSPKQLDLLLALGLRMI